MTILEHALTIHFEFVDVLRCKTDVLNFLLNSEGIDAFGWYPIGLTKAANKEMKSLREEIADLEAHLNAYFVYIIEYGDVKADHFNLSTRVGVFPFGVPAGLDVKNEKKKNQ